MTMSDSGIDLTFDSLDTGSIDIKNGASAIENRLAQMDRDLQPTKADWQSDASQAYQDAQRKWNQALDDMRTVLQQIGQTVGDSNTGYQEGEKANKGRWVV